MSINELDIKNSLQNLIVKNNTNTSDYDLSSSITSKVVTVSGANADKVATINIDYPAVFVKLNNHSDNHNELGNTARRDVDLEFRISCIMQEEAVAIDNAENIDNENIQLTHNLQELLRNNVKISNTVDWCTITGTDYPTEEGIYNARSDTTLTVRKRG